MRKIGASVLFKLYTNDNKRLRNINAPPPPPPAHGRISGFLPKTWHCLDRIVYIYIETVKRLDLIDTFSYVGGLEVRRQTGLREVPGSISLLWQEFLCLLFLLLLLCLFVQRTLFIMKVCNSFSNINLLCILNILKKPWHMIRVSRCRPSIFKADPQTLDTNWKRFTFG